MAAGKCGCAGTTCSCVIKGDGVTGAGSVSNPYVITAGVDFKVQSSATVDHTLMGDGSTGNPWTLTSDATLALGELVDVDTTVTTVGYVPARQPDGTFAMAPPATAAAGTIAAGNSIQGDGSSGSPLNVRLNALSGLLIAAGGLSVAPFTVASEAVLDATYGALPVGSLVSTPNASGVWIRTAAGWAALREDSGLISTIAGNMTAATGWTVNTFSAQRVNGTVQMRITVTTTISRSTAQADGNASNISVATVVPTMFRPVMESPLRVLGAGADHAMYVTTSGGVFMSNFAAADVTYPAGYVLSLGGTWIGQ